MCISETAAGDHNYLTDTVNTSGKIKTSENLVKSSQNDLPAQQNNNSSGNFSALPKLVH